MNTPCVATQIWASIVSGGGCPFIGNLVNGFSRNYIDSATNTQNTLTFPGFPQLFPNAKPLVCTDNPATADNEGVCNGRLLRAGPMRVRVNTASSIYHSLQVRYDGRFRSQWDYGLTYTYSHAIDNTSEVFQFNGGNSNVIAQNPLDINRGERGNSGFDARHVFTANFIWDLPFFREQKGFLGRLLGGWQLSGIVLIQPGRRFNPVQQLSSRNPYEDSVTMQPSSGPSPRCAPLPAIRKRRSATSGSPTLMLVSSTANAAQAACRFSFRARPAFTYSTT